MCIAIDFSEKISAEILSLPNHAIADVLSNIIGHADPEVWSYIDIEIIDTWAINLSRYGIKTEPKIEGH